MSHQRQQIREAARAALVAAETAADDRVYETRAIPWKRLELPAIAVYTLSETVDDQTTAPRELKRTLELAIEIAVKDTENLDDAIDDLSFEVEQAIHADETLGGKASDCVLSSTEIDVFEDGAKPIGWARLVFDVTYYTFAPEAGQESDPATDDLSTISVDYNLNGDQPDEDDRAHDLIENLEE